MRSHSVTWRTNLRLPLGTTLNSKPSLITSTFSSEMEMLVLVEVFVDVGVLLDVWIVLSSSTRMRMLSTLIW